MGGALVCEWVSVKGKIVQNSVGQDVPEYGSRYLPRFATGILAGS